MEAFPDVFSSEEALLCAGMDFVYVEEKFGWREFYVRRAKIGVRMGHAKCDLK